MILESETYFLFMEKTHENETFISELRESLLKIKVHFDNVSKRILFFHSF